MVDRTEAKHPSHGPLAGLAAAIGRGRANESGQGLVEYALMLLLVAMAAIATMAILGTSLDDAYQTVVAAFP